MKTHSIRLMCVATVFGMTAAGVAGCGSSTSAPTAPAPDESKIKTPAATQVAPATPSVEKVAKREFKPVVIGGMTNTSSVPATQKVATTAMSVRDVIDQLKPIQVIMGQWRGTTRKDYGVSKAVDNHEWVWDLKTDPAKPALVMNSDKSPYIQVARITTGGSPDQFAMTVTAPDGVVRQLAGSYIEPVEDIAGDDNKLHRTFKLQFEQTDEEKEKWRYTFHQQENDRYLLEVDRRRGKAAFRRYDTVSTQREGTSFALSDSDYGEKTCIISQGLGTIGVSYNGKQYWVCCSGCKAAFDDDPEKWIAAAATRAKEKN